MKSSRGFAPIVIVLTLAALGIAWYVIQKPFQIVGNDTIKFNAATGQTFTLKVGETATDGPNGVTVKLDSITPGQYPMAVVNVISADKDYEANHTKLAKTWNLTPNQYVATQGDPLTLSAKWGPPHWPDPNSQTGVVSLVVSSIDLPTQTVTFTVETDSRVEASSG